MSQNKQSKKPAQPVTVVPKAEVIKPFKVPIPVVLLLAATLAIYCGSFYFGFTELDDSIFIKELHVYNEDMSNLITSFHRGVFDAVKDTYYRPLFLDSMIINYRFSEQNEMGYHVVNVMLHMVNVTLLYWLFKKLKLSDLAAFVLCLVFAVHPVLSQAVAWIPGRNDTMLALFTIPFLGFAVGYSDTGNIRQLVLSIFFLICAFFTKETALFDAPVAFVLLVFFLKKPWLEKRNLVQYGLWIGAFALWYGVRSQATLGKTYMEPGAMAHDFVHRLPLIIQYLGKIFFPFNLSVFPMQNDTVYYYGFAALVVLAVVIFLTKERDWMKILGGLFVFLLFLLPVLLVPNALNDQTFEHRLYLPIIGILLVVSQTSLVTNKAKDAYVLGGFVAVCAVFAAINYSHQKSFEDPISFWTQAQATSPHSAYATMMLAARTKDDKRASEQMMRKAYSLDSTQKYINFYMGQMLQDHDSVLASEKYLLAEKKKSDYYECDFYLARVAVEKKDMPQAISYMERYLSKDPSSAQANNNILLLYVNTNQMDKLADRVKKMQAMGMAVPPGILQLLKK